jgi:ribose 5-phosphate isomerase
VHRARAYKGSKLGPEKQARQNPTVGLGTGPAVRPYCAEIEVKGILGVNAVYVPTKSKTLPTLLSTSTSSIL